MSRRRGARRRGNLRAVATSVSVLRRSRLATAISPGGYGAWMKTGALAGAVAAGVWAASEPFARRVFGTPYSDVRLLGAPLRPGRGWRAAGVAIHLANGALFGAAFERLGGRGPARGIAVAQAENMLLWPGMALADRLHPDRRSGAWPPLLRNRRVFAQEVAMHTVFGAVLGALVRESRRP